MNKPYISSGNRKMSFPNFSLPACTTCPGSTPICRAKCYAKKAERLYKGVLPSRTNNLENTKSHFFVADMIEIIGKKKNLKYFRIHESGDFYNQKYLDKWIEIASRFPDINFLAWTKSFHLDYSKKPDNLKIIWSVMPDTKKKIPAGPKAYAGECKGMPNDVQKCLGHCDNCGVCWFLGDNKAVHFDIH